VKNGLHSFADFNIADEGVVVERVIHPEAPENHPNRGLALTKKSLERKQNNLHQKEAAQTSETEQ